ncbi:hypothetical protein ACFX2A_022330 [Malus domestica]
MKNYQALLTGVTLVPEAHYSTNQRPKRQYRRGKGGQKPPRQGEQNQSQYKGGNRAQKLPNPTSRALNFKNKGKAPETMDADMCYRCGSNDHWSCVCRAPQKVIAEYHSCPKKFESNFVQVDEQGVPRWRFLTFRRIPPLWKIRILDINYF